MLEACVDIEPRQADVLTRICDGLLITVADLKQEGVFQWLLAPQKPLPPESPDMLTLLWLAQLPDLLRSSRTVSSNRELRGQHDVDHVRKLRVGPRTRHPAGQSVVIPSVTLR
jgi:hypothetical protein